MTQPARIHIHCAKPGMVIGKGGAEIEKLRTQCEKIINKDRESPVKVFINIVSETLDKNAQSPQRTSLLSWKDVSLRRNETVHLSP